MDTALFAATTLEQIYKAIPSDSTLNENPYTGIQFVTIPKFQAFADKVAKQFSAVLEQQMTVAATLDRSNRLVRREMVRGGYISK